MSATIALALLLAAIMYRDNVRRSQRERGGEIESTDSEVIDKEDVIDRTDGQNLQFRYLL